jgi:hypothetical protein
VLRRQAGRQATGTGALAHLLPGQTAVVSKLLQPIQDSAMLQAEVGAAVCRKASGKAVQARGRPKAAPRDRPRQPLQWRVGWRRQASNRSNSIREGPDSPALVLGGPWQL